MINKHNLDPKQQQTLSCAVDLLYIAVQMLQDVTYHKDSHLQELEELYNNTEKISSLTFEIAEEFEPKKEYKDFMKAELVTLLASGLNDMVEIDEVNMTFKNIMDVLENRPQKKHIENVVNWTEREQERKEFIKFAFTEEFKNKYTIY